jgi:hypothetical protein
MMTDIDIVSLQELLSLLNSYDQSKKIDSYKLVISPDITVLNILMEIDDMTYSSLSFDSVSDFCVYVTHELLSIIK